MFHYRTSKKFSVMTNGDEKRPAVDIAAGQLLTQECHVKLSYVSSLKISVEKLLEGTLSGTSVVIYKGYPKLKIQKTKEAYITHEN